MATVDWIAAALELTGNWLVGNKKRICFALSLAANGIWIYIGASAGLWGLVAVCAVSAALNVRNWVKWGKN